MPYLVPPTTDAIAQLFAAVNGLGTPFATVAAMKAMSPDELAVMVDGQSVMRVASVHDFFIWDASDVRADDPVDFLVVNPTANGSNPGRLQRLCLPHPAAMDQKTWCVDEANATGLASNDNSGADATHPLLTASERWRRMGPGANWHAGAHYHVRYLSTCAVEKFEGDAPLNTVVYQHASMVDHQGASEILSGTVAAVDVLVTATNTPWAVTSAAPPTSWTASGCVDKRFRLTSGANANALSWGTLDQGGAVANAKMRLAEFLAPVASFAVAPFASPPVSTAGPSVGDGFVVEELRSVGRTYVGLRSTAASLGTFKVVLDGIATTIQGGEHCGIYSDGSQVSTGVGYMANHVMHQCKLLTIQDVGPKIVVGGYSALAGLTLANESNTIATITRFTVQGNKYFQLSGCGGNAGGQTWSFGQVGFFDMASPGVLVQGAGVRFNGPVIYGSGNTGPIIQLNPRGCAILSTGAFNQPIVTTSPAHVIVGQNPFTRTSVPAFDEAATPPAYTAPRLLSFANIMQTVALGGFDYRFMDPVSGAGFRQ